MVNKTLLNWGDDNYFCSVVGRGEKGLCMCTQVESLLTCTLKPCIWQLQGNGNWEQPALAVPCVCVCAWLSSHNEHVTACLLCHALCCYYEQRTCFIHWLGMLYRVVASLTGWEFVEKLLWTGNCLANEFVNFLWICENVVYPLNNVFGGFLCLWCSVLTHFDVSWWHKCILCLLLHRRKASLFQQCQNFIKKFILA